MRIGRKLLFSAVALALPIGLVSLLGVQAASAGSPPGDASGTVSCSSVTGLLKFSPPLSFSGSASSDTVSVKLVFHGCDAGGGSNVTSSNFNGKGKGTLTASSNNCNNLAGTQPVSGSVKVSWTGKDKSAHINPSTITFNSFTGTPAGANGNVGFTFANQPVSGSFSGTISGELDTNESAAQAAGNSAGGCGAKHGMKKLNIVSGHVSQP